MNKFSLFVMAAIAAFAITLASMYAIDDTSEMELADQTTAEMPAPKAPPNIVILIADDLGWNDIGPYDNRFVHTPNIDKLAASGLRFDNVFLTTSSCSASRASILTGKYPHSNGVVHLHQTLSSKETTVGLLLRQGGYYTEAVGKWHIGGEAKKQFSRVTEERSDSGTERWVERLQQRPAETPFFFWLASRDPHRPHTTTDDSVPYEYDLDTLEIPKGFVDGPGTKREFSEYYREVTRFDRDVGRVIAELEAQGVLNNTLVIVMSDNGRPFPGGKQHLYDDGIKTPFIVHWPQVITHAGVRQQLISTVDLAPSLLEWAGLPVPESMQGYSFASILTNPNSKVRDYIYAERNWHGLNYHERAIRSLNYLYKENQFPLHGACIRNPYSSKPSYKEMLQAYREGRLDGTERDCFAKIRAKVELMAIDSKGNVRPDNLAGDAKHTEALESMRANLKRWRQETGDFDYTPYKRPAKKVNSTRK